MHLSLSIYICIALPILASGCEAPHISKNPPQPFNGKTQGEQASTNKSDSLVHLPERFRQVHRKFQEKALIGEGISEAYRYTFVGPMSSAVVFRIEKHVNGQYSAVIHTETIDGYNKVCHPVNVEGIWKYLIENMTSFRLWEARPSPSVKELASAHDTAECALEGWNGSAKFALWRIQNSDPLVAVCETWGRTVEETLAACSSRADRTASSPSSLPDQSANIEMTEESGEQAVDERP